MTKEDFFKYMYRTKEEAENSEIKYVVHSYNTTTHEITYTPIYK